MWLGGGETKHFMTSVRDLLENAGRKTLSVFPPEYALDCSVCFMTLSL